MPKAMREMLEKGYSIDEPDRMPENIEITNFDILMYVLAIAGHFVDMAVDTNIAVRYYLAHKYMEFGWTFLFIVLPAVVNTAVSARMYSQDQQQDTEPDQFTKRRRIRIVMLILLMAPVMRVTDALIYALKSRKAERKRDLSSQRLYYKLMLKEDSDAALLKVFECFLEAAPQQVLQMSLLMWGEERFTLHQSLSIASSVVGMGWCLAAYQRAVRFTQQDKLNMNWVGSLLQTLWHFLVSLSRITAIAAMAYLFPHWITLACAVHILFMTTWLQFFDKSPFCAQNKMADILFSLALGAVYIFTYILPIEGRTRYRFATFYTLCFIENTASGVIWYLYAAETISPVYYYSILGLSVVPFVVGIVFMLVYYAFLHPKVRRGVRDFTITYKTNGDVPEIETT
ncbi:unnamed protein product [Plutella xylostella]|uniref:XK-related protein n=1 Tax=Plutella xylostella TaxID=51655 RepID=A0A8S4FU98_PLUXY|nr:unnamed protein product [Plutella xylostella]